MAAIALALASVASATAQNGTLTPYSKYGYGILNDNATAAQRSMGGVGYAMSSGRQANVMNPASYAAIDSLTFLFDIGADLSFLWSEDAGVREHSNTGGLDYITMAFPISKRIGASIGVLPYASTGYAFGNTIDNGSVSRTGSGNISMLYAGVGINPWNKFYVGANFAYMFGTTINDVYATTITNSTSLFERFMRVRDWKVDIGVQYSFNVNRENKFTVGVTFSPGKSMHGETYGIHYDASLDSKPDTTGYTKLSGLYSMPATYGAGLNYTYDNRLTAELDFTYQPWKNAKYASLEDFETNTFDNRWKLAAGLQWIPRPRGSYIQRINYRIGAYFNHDYIMVRGNNVREIGATVGFGFPIPMFKTTVNLGFEYKHRQAHPTPLVKEDYCLITLGVNFNEMWFRKSKIY